MGHAYKELDKFCPEDVNAEQFVMERLHLGDYPKGVHSSAKENIKITDLIMKEYHIDDTFPKQRNCSLNISIIYLYVFYTSLTIL